MEITKLIRILIVEDSEEDAELIRFELDQGGMEHLNHRVATASELSAALDKQTWDVVLSDYSLPGFGGVEALQMLKARELDIPFILISGTIGEDIAVETMKAGAHDYLIKGKLSRLVPIVYRELREYEIRASHRKIHNVIRKSEERIRISHKMEAVGRLAGGMAHNFNNLLTVINGYNEIALNTLDPSHPLRADLLQVKDSVAKATLMTRQLLDFSRGKVMAPQPLDLNTAIRDTHRMLVPMVRDDIEIILVAEADPARIKADPGQIQQVIMNLVLNARDAMPQGGSLRLKTGNAFLNEPFPAFASRFKPGPYVTFTVQDSGIGMDEATREHLFEPFFTTKEFGKGTGLGLATVYGIVTHSGGQIQVQSKVGQGSTFSVYFPALDKHAGQQSPAAAPKPEIAAVPRGEGSILLAENDEGVRTLIMNVLSRNGYRVLGASNGEEALRLSQECGQIHLLLTDVIMPGMSGMQLAGKLSQKHPESKTIFMSGYNANEVDSRRLGDSSLDVLEKPFTPDHLLRKIQATLI